MGTNGKPKNRRKWVIAALEEFESRLTTYAARLLGDEDLARDAVQHTFLKLCDQSPDELDSRLAAWLYTVCRNKSLDLLRAGGRSESLDDDDLEPAGREHDPADVVEHDDLHECLRQLVATLPSAQREAIVLWQAGFTYREIGDITNRSEGAARVLVHRALTTLREHPWTRRLLEEESFNGKPKATA